MTSVPRREGGLVEKQRKELSSEDKVARIFGQRGLQKSETFAEVINGSPIQRPKYFRICLPPSLLCHSYLLFGIPFLIPIRARGPFDNLKSLNRPLPI